HRSSNPLCPCSGRAAVLPRHILQRQRLHGFRSELSIRRVEEFHRCDRQQHLSTNTDQHLHLHHRSPGHRTPARQICRHAADAGIPRPRHCPPPPLPAV